MSRPLAEIERDIRELSDDDRAQLLRSLISDLDGPADPDAKRAWLDESERRLAEIESGDATAVPGENVVKEARTRLK